MIVIIDKILIDIHVWCADGKILVEDIVKLGAQAEETAESDDE